MATIATEIFTLKGELDNRVQEGCKILHHQLKDIELEIQSLFDNPDYATMIEENLVEDRLFFTIYTSEPKFTSVSNDFKSYDVIVDGYHAVYELTFEKQQLKVERYFTNSDGDITESDDDSTNPRYARLGQLLRSGQILAQVLEYVYDNK